MSTPDDWAHILEGVNVTPRLEWGPGTELITDHYLPAARLAHMTTEEIAAFFGRTIRRTEVRHADDTDSCDRGPLFQAVGQVVRDRGCAGADRNAAVGGPACGRGSFSGSPAWHERCALRREVTRQTVGLSDPVAQHRVGGSGRARGWALIAFLAWLLGPLLEAITSVFPRPVDGDTIDSSQLAFALKRTGYVPRFAAVICEPRILLGAELRTVVEKPRKRRRKARRVRLTPT